MLDDELAENITWGKYTDRGYDVDMSIYGRALYKFLRMLRIG